MALTSSWKPSGVNQEEFCWKQHQWKPAQTHPWFPSALEEADKLSPVSPSCQPWFGSQAEGYGVIPVNIPLNSRVPWVTGKMEGLAMDQIVSAKYIYLSAC